MGKPTNTERLLYGENGASDPRDPFRLERDLISSEKWPELFNQMPAECQKATTEGEPGASIGIGRNGEVGWFVLGCGQGPFLIWAEFIGLISWTSRSSTTYYNASPKER